MSSDLLNKMMSQAGVSNEANIEKARAELAGAITRVVINEALAEMKVKKAQIDAMTVKAKETGADKA